MILGKEVTLGYRYLSLEKRSERSQGSFIPLCQIHGQWLHLLDPPRWDLIRYGPETVGVFDIRITNPIDLCKYTEYWLNCSRCSCLSPWSNTSRSTNGPKSMNKADSYMCHNLNGTDTLTETISVTTILLFNPGPPHQNISNYYLFKPQPIVSVLVWSLTVKTLCLT